MSLINFAISQVSGQAAKYLGDVSEAEKKKLDQEQTDNKTKGLSTLSQEEYNQALYSNTIKAIKNDVAGSYKKASDFVAKLATDPNVQAALEKSKQNVGAQRTTNESDPNNAAKLATEGTESPFAGATKPKTKLEDPGSPILKSDEGASIDERMNLHSYNQLDPNNPDHKKLLGKIKDAGSFVGENFVQHGYLRMHDFSKLEGKDKDGKPNGLIGESKLSANEFTEAMAKLGFMANGDKAAQAIDSRLTATQRALKGTGLEKDGSALALLQARVTDVEKVKEKVTEGEGETAKEVEKEFSKLNLGIDLKNSEAISMLKDAKAISENKDLKNVAAKDRSSKAHEVNKEQFDKYNKLGDKTEGTLSQLGINPEKMDQFSGAAYAQGAQDFNKLTDKSYIDQVKQALSEAKDGKTPSLNISIGVGSNYKDDKGVYADASRGQDMATLSQLSEERGGFGNKQLNQLALVAHGEDGMNKVLDQISAFKENFTENGKYKGPEINLDLGLYGHSNSKGEMFMNADSASGPDKRFGANKAEGLMDKVQNIVGNDGAANITTWGCNTNKTVDAIANANKNSDEKDQVGSLTVTGTSNLAESSSGNLSSNDTITTFKRDEDGSLMSQNITTNGHGNDTYQVRQATDSYKADFKKSNNVDLSTQQFSKENAEQSKKITQENPGSLRSGPDDGKNGNGSLEAGDIAEAKNEAREERDRTED